MLFIITSRSKSNANKTDLLDLDRWKSGSRKSVSMISHRKEFGFKIECLSTVSGNSKKIKSNVNKYHDIKSNDYIVKM